LRLAKAGETTLRLHLDGTFSPGPAPASITVAQIKGNEHPDEQVIIGGHLDSWDLGEGAVDNGTGAMAVVEAARLLESRSAGLPRRTLTFVLSSARSKAAAESNPASSPAGSACSCSSTTTQARSTRWTPVLIDDSGAGRITSISARERLADRAAGGEDLRAVAKSVSSSIPIANEYFGGTDNAPVPVGGRSRHPSASRKPPATALRITPMPMCFALVQPEALQQQAAVLAAWMWNVSELAGVRCRTMQRA